MCRLDLEGRICDLIETAHVGGNRHGGFHVVAGIREAGCVREEDEAEYPLIQLWFGRYQGSNA